MQNFSIRSGSIVLSMLAKGIFSVVDIAIISVLLTQTVFNANFHTMISESKAISNLLLGIIIVIFVLALLFVRMAVKDIIGVLNLKKLLDNCKNAAIEVDEETGNTTVRIGTKKKYVQNVFTKITDVKYEEYSFYIIGEGKEVFFEDDEVREYDRKSMRIELPLLMSNFKKLKSALYNAGKKVKVVNYDDAKDDA